MPLATKVPPLDSETAVIPAAESFPVPLAVNTMSFKVIDSPTALLVTTTPKTGTLTAPGICVELSKLGTTAAMLTAGVVRVLVGVAEGVLVAVFEGVFVGVMVGLFVGVSVGVFVGVSVGLFVGVLVDVMVAVFVGEFEGVFVGVSVGVSVGVPVGLFVAVGVAVAALTVWVFPVKSPPDRIAPWPVVAPMATMDVLLIELLKVWFARPLTLKSNTNSKVAGWLLLTVTTPLAASEKVTLPVGLKLMFPCSRVPPL